MQSKEISNSNILIAVKICRFLSCNAEVPFLLLSASPNSNTALINGSYVEESQSGVKFRYPDMHNKISCNKHEQKICCEISVKTFKIVSFVCPPWECHFDIQSGL